MHDLNTVTLSPTARGLRAAVALLHAGDLVAFPTETVYGLGGDARSDRAVAGIFAAKGRPTFNPLIVHVEDTASAVALVDMPPAARTLADRFWPGPLTLVLRRRAKSGLSDLATAGLDTVGVRVPANPLAQRLLAGFAGPIAAPSANLSGRISPTTRAHVLDGLGGRIAAVLDGGPCAVGLESTIIGFQEDRPVLLRPGGLPLEAIAQALGQPVSERREDGISAPGQLTSHYAPTATLRLDASDALPGEVWLGFGPTGSQRAVLNLSATGNIAEAAANLFSHLREMDSIAERSGAAGIAVAPIPLTGLGRAINDRLRRAAAPRTPRG